MEHSVVIVLKMGREEMLLTAMHLASRKLFKLTVC